MGNTYQQLPRRRRAVEIAEIFLCWALSGAPCAAAAMPGPVCIESRVELFVALVEAAQQQRTKMEIPDPVVDLLEPDVLVDQRMADVEPALLPADSAVSTDAPDLEVAGVLHARYY